MPGPLKYADRVKEGTSTTGTGTLTLAGAITGYQTFAAIGDGNRCVYCIDNNAGEWEVGIGTYTASGTTLSRDSVIASSNSNALVSFAAGTKQVFVTKAARNLSGLTSEAGMVTAYEIDWSARSSTTYSNGNTITHDGYTWNFAIAGGGAGIEIVNGQGLKFTRGTGDDDTFAWAGYTVSGNNGIGLPAYALGIDHVRRRPWALWVRVYAYNLATSGDWSYVLLHGATYPYNYTAVRRSRNTHGVTNNTTTGGLSAWTAWGTTGDIGQALMDSTISYGDSPADTPHTGTQDVICMLFHEQHNVSIYYGTWSSGWPTFASLTMGAELNGGSSFPPINSASQRRSRDPAKTRTGWGVGGGTNSAHAHTIGQLRITYWDP